MTVISARWRSNMPFQRRQKCIFRWPVMGRYWVGVNCYITECTGNSITLVTRYDRESQYTAEGALGTRDWVWGSEEMEKWCCRENSPSRELGPRVSAWAAQENGKETLMANRVGRSICLQFCSVSNSLSHTTFQIKWEVYISKRLCRSSSLLCRRYDFACTCVCMVGHGYTTFCQWCFANVNFSVEFRLCQFYSFQFSLSRLPKNDLSVSVCAWNGFKTLGNEMGGIWD